MSTQSNPQHSPLQLLVALLVLSMVSAIFGFLYYRHQRQQIIADKQSEVSAIAELKVNEISRWLKERKRDGGLIGASPLLERGVQQLLQDPHAGGPAAELHAWLDTVRQNYDYRAILIADNNGTVLLSISANGLDPEIGKHFARLAAAKEPLFIDLHRSAIDGEISCGLLVPIVAERGDAMAGVLVLQIDPTEFLYPFLQSWPTPSHTAETLLVRQEGGDLVVLNELRYRKNTTLSLRLPVDEKEPSAMAQVLTREGVVEGADYRGAQVLAALKAVPDSPWFFIAKVDTDEICALARGRAWLTAVLVTLLAAAVGAGLIFIWKHQKVKLCRRQNELEAEKLELAQRYQYLTNYANDVIMLADSNGRIVEVNERATASYGYTREEFLKLTIRDIRAPESLPSMEQQWRQIKEQNGLVFETTHRRKDGSVFPVEISVRIVQFGGVEYYWGTLRDISERKRTEEALRRAHDDLELRVAERTRELTELNVQMRQEIQERRMAQKAVAEQARVLEAFFSHSVTPLVFLTPEFEFIRVNEAYAKACQRNVEDFIGRNHFELYPSDAKEIFDRVVATRQPYQVFGRPFVFPDHPEWGVTYWDWTLVPLLDDQGEVELLVYSLNDVTERRRVESFLEKSEEKYRELVENANCIIMKLDVQGNITFFNEFAQKFFGFGEREILGRSAAGTIFPLRDSTGTDYVQMVSDLVQHPEQHTTGENENVRRDGERVWVAWTNKALHDDSGRVSGLLCIGSDITDRKKTEHALQESEKQLRFLSSKLLTAQEEERKRIARELHDSIGSSLSAIKFGLENSSRLDHDDRGFQASLQGLTSIVQEAIEEVRRITSDLRPSILDDLGLVTTLGWFFRQFLAIQPGICVEDQLDLDEDEIPEGLKIVIFRVIQEAFHNISKYSNAELVNFFLGRYDNTIELVIEDNGDGFDVDAVLSEGNDFKGLGLTSMRERIELSGGVFSIESLIGEGTTIRASWQISALLK